MGLIGTLGLVSNVSNLSLTDVNMVDVTGSSGALAARGRGIVTQCLSTGAVQGIKQAGGLVGANEGLIEASFSLAAVHSMNGAGGLVGDNSGVIQACYAAGDVGGQGVGAGGLVGVNRGLIARLVLPIWLEGGVVNHQRPSKVEVHIPVTRRLAETDAIGVQLSIENTGPRVGCGFRHNVQVDAAEVEWNRDVDRIHIGHRTLTPVHARQAERQGKHGANYRI